MSASDEITPDGAMERAVEILARVYEAGRARSNVPPAPLDRPVVLANEGLLLAPASPAPLDRPVVLANEGLVLALASTTRREVERAFGIAFAYPMRGWHTYAAREQGRRNFLSLFYSAAAGTEPGRSTLVALEYYLPKSDGAPGLAARDYGPFRLEPGDVALGAPTSALDVRYVKAVGGPAPVVYAEAFEARWDGGVAYVMGNGGRVERLGLYAAT